VAVPKRSTDLWGHVQRLLSEQTREGRTTVATPGGTTIPLPRRHHVDVEDDPPAQPWHDEDRRDRADLILGLLEDAVASGRRRHADRLRAAWLRGLQTDRVARVRWIGSERSMRCDPNGRGPLFDGPAVHYRDRLPWSIVPVTGSVDLALPARAARTLRAWEEHGAVFDRWYVAQHPVGSAPVPCYSLIGVISSDGLSGDWFVLDRWGA
jgi:hypothetical protein